MDHSSRLDSARLSALLTEYGQLKTQLPHFTPELAGRMRRRLTELDAAVDSYLLRERPDDGADGTG
jgi:hypothetical protein